MKKIISLILSLVMLLSFASALSVSAETTLQTEVGADGKTYYLIGSADDYLAFVELANADLSINGKLTADIDLSGKTVTSIGVAPNSGQSTATSYQGVFDGQGHIISNMSISRTFSANASAGIAMFNMTDGATIKNLGIENATITNKGAKSGVFLSVLVGRGYATTIENCYVKNSTIVSTKNANYIQAAGPIAGFVNGASAVKNCYSIGNEIGFTESGGSASGGVSISGFIGYISASAAPENIVNSYAKGNKLLNRPSGQKSAGFVRVGSSGQTDVAFANSYTDLLTNFDSGSSLTKLAKDDAAWVTLADTLGAAYKNDTYSLNGGAPRLAWEYDPISYSITVDSEILGGSVTADKESAEAGETVTLTVTPDEGYLLDWVKVNGEELEYPYTFTMPAEDVVITAGFVEEVTVVLYDITIDSSITNGTVTTYTYEAQEGDTITLTVTPDEECVIDWVKVNGVEISTPYTFAMPAEDVTVTASFSEIPKYAITVSEVAGGTVTASKSLAMEGEEITFTVTPDADYKIKSVKVNGEELQEPYKFTMPGTAVTITVEFEEIQYFLIGSADDYLAFVEAANADLTINGKLTADIDLAGKTVTSIGVAPNSGQSTATSYQGIFDGKGHVIRNMTISRAFSANASAGIAMFNMTDGATIKNLGIENATITNTSAKSGVFLSALVGRSYGSTIENCYVKNSTIVSTKNGNYIQAAGPIAAYINDKTVVKNCYSIGNEVGFTESGGTASGGVSISGFVGWLGGTPTVNSIQNSYAKGNTLKNRPSGQKSAGFARVGSSGNTNVAFTNSYVDVKEGFDASSSLSAIAPDSTEWNTLANTLGSAYKNDTFSINGGAPRLAWEKDPVEYNITVSADIVNGTVTAPSKAYEGTEVELSFTCADGYAVDSVYVNGEEISYPYTFTMPSEDVVITATFVLEIGLAEADAEMITGIPESVKEGFTLPIAGEKHNSLITWTSNDSSIAIDNATGEAVVTRYNYQTGDKTVTLTAEVKYGSASVTKTFEVVVLKLMPDADYVNAIFETITWETLSEESETAVTKNLTLPAKYNDDIVYTWSSNKLYYVTNDGIVTRPMYGDETIELTLSYKLELGGEVKKVFTFIVKGGMANYGSAVADADAALKYIKDKNTVNYINADVKLMKEATYGSTVTYSSSDTTVVANDGKVTRPTDSDKKVTLTITAVKGEFTEIRTVELVVKKKSSEPAGGGSGGGGSSGGGGGGGGSSSGGGSSVPKGDITDIIKEDLENDAKEEAPVEPTVPAGVFSDIANHWAKDYIEKMYEAGIVNGKSEGIFAPDDTITREEFITMLIRALGIETIEGSSKFLDVNEDDWFAPFVNAAYKNNITDGMSVDKFGIGANISRQDMCVMIYNAVSGQLETKDASESFSDDNSIASYAKTAVYNLKENGIVNGRGENSFVPQGTATRAEAIKIISSIKENLTQETEAK